MKLLRWGILFCWGMIGLYLSLFIAFIIYFNILVAVGYSFFWWRVYKVWSCHSGDYRGLRGLKYGRLFRYSFFIVVVLGGIFCCLLPWDSLVRDFCLVCARWKGWNDRIHDLYLALAG